MSVTLKEAYSNHLTPKDFNPKVIPNVAEDIFTSSVYLDCITLTNQTDVDATVTVTDKQDTPLPILSQIAVAARDTVHLIFPGIMKDSGGRYCPGGVSWVASAADTIVGYARGRL